MVRAACLTTADGSASSLHQSDLNELLVSVSCLLLMLPYQLQMKPRLVESGLTCPSNDLSLFAHSIMDIALVYRIAALAVCCKSVVQTTQWVKRVRLSARVIIPAALMLVFIAQLGPLALYGTCGFCELVWHLFIGWISALPGTVFTLDVATHRSRSRGRITSGEAEVRAAQILGELQAVSCEEGVLPPVLSACSTVGGQCPICLSDWEPMDTIKVTPCHHGFHQQCLQNWLSHQVLHKRVPSCVVCRHPLERSKGDKWAARR